MSKVQGLKDWFQGLFSPIKNKFDQYVSESRQVGPNSYFDDSGVLHITKPESSPSPSPSPTPTPTPKPSVLGSQYAQPTPTPASLNGQYYGRNPSTTSGGASSDIDEALSQASNKFNVPLALLYDIAMQESSLGRNMQNPGSSAGGLFQFLDSTWKDSVNRYAKNPKMSLYNVLPSEDKMDPYANALMAAYLISKGQLGKWDESLPVWGNFWPQDELKGLGFYDQTLDRKE